MTVQPDYDPIPKASESLFAVQRGPKGGNDVDFTPPTRTYPNYVALPADVLRAAMIRAALVEYILEYDATAGRAYLMAAYSTTPAVIEIVRNRKNHLPQSNIEPVVIRMGSRLISPICSFSAQCVSEAPIPQRLEILRGIKGFLSAILFTMDFPQVPLISVKLV